MKTGKRARGWQEIYAGKRFLATTHSQQQKIVTIFIIIPIGNNYEKFIRGIHI